MNLNESVVNHIEDIVEKNLMEELDEGERGYEYDPAYIEADFAQMSAEAQISIFRLLQSPREYSILLNTFTDEKRRTLKAIKSCLLRKEPLH